MVLPDGTTSFQALQNAMSGGGGGELAYFVFDLPAPRRARPHRRHARGAQAGAGAPAEGRRADRGPAPTATTSSERATRFSPAPAAWGWKGSSASGATRRYEAGRSKSWLKVKCLKRQEFVIGGYTDPEGSRDGIGALLLGVHDEQGRLVFAGKVGTGFTRRRSRTWRRGSKPLQRPASPFGRARIPGVTRAHWVEPKLVAEVRLHRVDERRPPAPSVVPGAARGQEGVGGRARARRSRSRRRAREATRPTPARSRAGKDADGRRCAPHQPDRVVFDGPGVTKLDLAHYYERIADRILPHIEGRPADPRALPRGRVEALLLHEAHRRLGAAGAARG